MSDVMHVLLIEDDAVDAVLLQGVIVRAGHSAEVRLTHVSTLTDALTLLEPHRERRWDLVLTGLNLPDAAGVETVRRLREMIPTGLPIVVLTHLDARAIAVSALQAGAQDYLVKDRLTGTLVLQTMRHAIERGHYDRRLREQYAQSLLRQRSEALGQLADGIVGEVTDAMMMVSTLVEFLQDEARDDQREDLGQVAATAERITTLMSQLSGFHRREAQGPTTADPNQLIRASATMLRQLIGAATALSLDLEPDVGLVEADRALLEVALLNLVLNSRSAMPGGGTIHVSTRALSLTEPMSMNDFTLPPGTWLQLTVQDDGQGMNEAIRARCFQPYVTTRTDGSGVGLASVYGIIKQHRGFIAVTSAPDVGTVFEVYLPCADGLGAPAALRLDDLRGVETVLMADPIKESRVEMAAVLTARGYRVLPVSTVADAMEAIDGDAPLDLLLINSRFAGAELMALVQRASKRRPGLPIVPIGGETQNAVPAPATRIRLLQGVRRALDAA
jgi:two-component system cell cycle sensor histidine kinase/response regulator CckA